MEIHAPNGLKNMTIYFGYNKDEEIDRVITLKAIDPRLDLEVELQKMSLKSEYRAANVYIFKKERIKTPKYLFNGVDNVAIVRYYQGKRDIAILPYFIAFSEL